MFSVLGIFFLTLVANLSWEDEIKEIDQQIEQLQQLQEQLRASAQRNVNNAMRWQFQQENYLDARRAWDKAAADKQKIQELQDQIGDLEKRKKKILEEHGQKSSP